MTCKSIGSFFCAGLLAVAVVAAFARPAAALDRKDVQDCSQNIDLDRAIQGCTRVAETRGANAQSRAAAYANRGAVYYAKRDDAHAIADLGSAISIDPKNAATYVMRALAYDRKGEFDLAIADLNEALRLNPKLAVARNNRASAYYAKGEYDRAIEEFNETIRIDPREPHAYNGRGNSYEAKGDHDRAIADHNEAIRLKPDYAHAYYDRAASYEKMGDHDRAITDLNDAVRIDPKLAVAYNSRGLVYLIEGDVDRAIADYSGAIRADPSYATAYNNRGSAYFDKVDYDRSIADLNEAIRLDPQLALACLHRADIYRIRGDYQRAIADYSEAIRINPQFIAAYAGRGQTYERLAEFAKAHADFNSALTIQQKDQNAKLDRDRNLAQERARERLAALSDSSPPAAPVAAAAVPPASAPVAVNDRRIALVIGNSAYENVPALANPVRDAAVVAETLKRTGFESVTVLTNMRREAVITALRNFANQSEQADWAVVYYAGHGMEVGGINYLIPTDARIAADRDIGFEAVPLEQVLNAAERARKLRLVILDACRDNPFASQMKRTLTVASRSVSRGLAAVEPEAGTLVVYAAKDGETAIDGDGSNSPFAQAFVKNLQTPGLEIRRLFDFVRDDVMDATGRRQKPFSYGSISGRQDFYFVAGK